MKYFLRSHIIALIPALIAGVLLYKFDFQDSRVRVNVPQDLHYIASFNDDEFLEIYAAGKMKSKFVILMGSSELTSGSEAVPHFFFPAQGIKNIVSIGHAGNQDFSILTQLLANADVVEGMNIVIILSPGWFAGKSSLGTSLPVFLENNSPRFFDKIAESKESEKYVNYISEYLSQNQSNISHISLSMRILINRYRANSGFAGLITHYPLALENKLEASLNRAFHSYISPEKVISIGSQSDTFNRKPTPINWDSLIETSAHKAAAKATTNAWGINDDYYREYVGGTKAGRFYIPPVDHNHEFADLVVLLDFLEEKKCRAGFIIQPMNPYYYSDLPKLQPTIDSVVKRINDHGFDALNLFCSDSTTYDKSLLNDVMHLGDAGWYRVDRYIYEKFYAHEKN